MRCRGDFLTRGGEDEWRAEWVATKPVSRGKAFQAEGTARAEGEGLLAQSRTVRPV